MVDIVKMSFKCSLVPIHVGGIGITCRPHMGPHSSPTSDIIHGNTWVYLCRHVGLCVSFSHFSHFAASLMGICVWYAWVCACMRMPSPTLFPWATSLVGPGPSGILVSGTCKQAKKYGRGLNLVIFYLNNIVLLKAAEICEITASFCS